MTTTQSPSDTKRSRYLDSLAADMERRIATGDLQGATVERLEKGANYWRYQAEMARRGK